MKTEQPIYLEGEGIRHNCAVTGVYSHNSDAVSVTANMLQTLNPRGQEGAGTFVANRRGDHDIVKGSGWVRTVLTPDIQQRLAQLEPHIAIGQDRYSTAGKPDAWQPFSQEIQSEDMAEPEPFALVHNGNITNIDTLLAMLPQELQSEALSDSWILHQCIIHAPGESWEEKIAYVAERTEGAYSLIMTNGKKIFAVKDPWDMRPLVAGELPNNGGIVLASETSAFSPLGAKKVRDIQRGEGVVIDENGMQPFFLDKRTDIVKAAKCIFEYVYFSSPDSIIFGKPVAEVRRNIGKIMAQNDAENGFLPDAIVPILYSGMVFAEGYSKEMIRLFCENPERFGKTKDDIAEVAASLVPTLGSVANQYAGRIFIEPSNRKNGTIAKHRAVPDAIQGKNIVMIDDSIVRGNTTPALVKLLKKQAELFGYEGANSVHVRIGSPPIKAPCYMGVDFASSEELVINQAGGDMERVRQMFGADSLRYLTQRELVAATVGEERIKDIPDEELFSDTDHCGACFNGQYPFQNISVFSK